MVQTRRWLAVSVAILLGAPAVPGRADERYLRCESGTFGRYKACAIDTQGRVEVAREFSRNKCVQWRTWGYDKRTVWVDRGCRAEFRVGKDGGGIGAGGAAVIGAAAGAVLLGTILATRDHKSEATGAPDWARGRFEGFSPKLETDFDVTVASDGQVSGEANGTEIHGHVTPKGALHLGDTEYDIKKESWGFSAKQKGDSAHVIYFRRRN